MVDSSGIVVTIVVGEFVAAAFVSLFSVYDALSTGKGCLFGFYFPLAVDTTWSASAAVR